MTVESLLSGLVAQMTSNSETYSFYSTSSDIQNTISDDAVLPVVFLTRPFKIKPEIVTGGHFKQTYYCNVLILFKDSFENTESEKNSIYEKALLAQRELHLLLDNDSNVKNLVVDICPEIEHLFDSDVSGIMMPFSFELRNTDSVCV
jgi:hypothetical protein